MFINLYKKVKSRIKWGSLIERVTNGLFWVLIGNVGSKLLMLLSFIIVARYLGKNAYGELGIVRSTLTMFFTLASLGLGMTASRYISLFRESDREKVLKIFKFSSYSSLFFGVVFSFFLFIFSNYIAKQSLNNENLEILLKIGAISILFNCINSAFSGVLMGFESFKINGILNLITGISQFLLIIAGVYYMTSVGVILALVINAILTFILNLYVLVKQYSFNFKFNFSEIFDQETKKIFFTFSIPSVLLSLLQLPVLWFVKIILTKNAGFDAMAEFDVAEQWYMILLFLPNTINSILLPIMTSLNVNNKDNEFSRVLNLSLISNFFITAFFVVFIYFFSPTIFSFYGKEFTNFKTLNIMALSTIFSSLCNVFVQFFASKGQMWFGFITNIFWVASMIIFSVWLVQYEKNGAVGLAYTMLISNVLLFLIQFFSYKYRYKNLI